MTTNQKELIRQLNENQNIIKELTFCNNCKNQHSCYIFSVFSMIGMSFSYCAAGIPMKPAEFEILEENGTATSRLPYFSFASSICPSERITALSER